MIQKPVQIIIRLCLRTPLLEKIGWGIVPYVIRIFKKLYGTKRFITRFDDDINIWASHFDAIESQIFWQGVQKGDRGAVKLLKKVIKPDFVFFDVGANIGVFSLLSAKRLTKGYVHAFEPSGYHIDKFRKNMALNKFNNIILNQFALFSSNSEKTLYFPNKWNTGEATLYMSAQTDECSDKETVITVKMDGYVEKNNINRIDIIKIDVEGAELDVLEGGYESIARLKPLIIMEVNMEHLSRTGRGLQDLMDIFANLEYRIFRIEHSSKLTSIASIDDFTDHQNILCHHMEDKFLS